MHVQNLSPHVAVLDNQLTDAHRQFEAPWSCAARIEIEHAVALLLLGNMAVSADHDRKSCGLGPNIQMIEIVKNVNRGAC